MYLYLLFPKRNGGVKPAFRNRSCPDPESVTESRIFVKLGINTGGFMLPDVRLVSDLMIFSVLYPANQGSRQTAKIDEVYFFKSIHLPYLY